MSPESTGHLPESELEPERPHCLVQGTRYCPDPKLISDRQHRDRVMERHAQCPPRNWANPALPDREAETITRSEKNVGPTVTLLTSDGLIVGDYQVVDGVIDLRRNDERDIWLREGARLDKDLRRLRAIQSRNITIQAGKLYLDDGSEAGEELLVSWGWRKTERGWSIP